MTEPTIPGAVDRLRRQRDTVTEQLQLSGGDSMSAEERLGLRYRPGDRVIDLATGRRGAVLSGRLSQATSAHVYDVRMVDGNQVIRLETELGPDQPPTPAPAR